MPAYSLHQASESSHAVSEALFENIANDLIEKGFSVNPNALPLELTNMLFEHQQLINESKFVSASIGRGKGRVRSEFVRKDQICWITGDSIAGAEWLHWSHQLKQYLNRRLFLGLFSFESHFSHYSPGDFYKRHLDAFKGKTNRVLSLVVYLNSNWSMEDGGELVIYKNRKDKEGVKVVPTLGTVVAFLSEEFPHEVLPARRDRYSIAGWFRVNTSINNEIDPPK